MANTDVTKMAFFAVTNPKLLTIDPETAGAEGSKRAWEVIKKNDAKKAEESDKRKEYNRLRQQLYNLQQYAKSNEVNCNNRADAVKGLEKRINDLLKLKKQATDAGHLGDERKYEHQVQLLETELIDAKEEFTKAKLWSTQSARAFKSFEFENKQRIAELKEQLDKPLPVK